MVTLVKRSPICQYPIFILAPAERSLVNTDNCHYYSVCTACKYNKCKSLIFTKRSVQNVAQIELVLAQNFHSKANPAIDAAASYFTKSSTRNRLAYCTVTRTRTRACRPQLFQLLSICVFSARTVAVPDRIPPLRISSASLSLTHCSALLVAGLIRASWTYQIFMVHVCSARVLVPHLAEVQRYNARQTQ